MKEFIKKLLGYTGYGIVNAKVLNAPQKQKQITRQDFFNLYFSKVNPETFFFVQIGASDGNVADPIYEYTTRYRLHGVVVEPQTEIFGQLGENYKGYPVICVKAAIAKESGFLPFWVVKKSSRNEQNWGMTSRIASFDKATIKKTVVRKIPRGENSENHIEQVSIKALSFSDLVREYNLKNIDLLQIDAEGYDYEILKTIDFSRFMPQLINFESQHLSVADRAACETMLTQFGYKFFRYGSDTCAYKI